MKILVMGVAAGAVALVAGVALFLGWRAVRQDILELGRQRRYSMRLDKYTRMSVI